MLLPIIFTVYIFSWVKFFSVNIRYCNINEILVNKKISSVTDLWPNLLWKNTTDFGWHYLMYLLQILYEKPADLNPSYKVRHSSLIEKQNTKYYTYTQHTVQNILL